MKQRKIERMLIQNEEGMNALRTAIVRLAVKDYVRFSRRLKVVPDTHSKRAVYVSLKRDAEQFLGSDWAEFLVDLDCKYILKRIKEIEDE